MNTLFLCLLAAVAAGVVGFSMAYFDHRKDYANTDTGAAPFDFIDVTSFCASAVVGLEFSAYVGIELGFGWPTISTKFVAVIVAVIATVFGVLQARKHGRAKRAAAKWFKALDAADAGSTSENPIRDLGKVQYFAGVTIVGTVNAIHENGVTIGFTVSSCYYEGFAPFAEFRDQDLTKEALMSRQLQFALVYPDQAEAYLSVLGGDKRRSDNDWPVSIWC